MSLKLDSFKIFFLSIFINVLSSCNNILAISMSMFSCQYYKWDIPFSAKYYRKVSFWNWQKKNNATIVIIEWKQHLMLEVLCTQHTQKTGRTGGVREDLNPKWSSPTLYLQHSLNQPHYTTPHSLYQKLL